MANGVYERDKRSLTKSDRKSLQGEEPALFVKFSVLNGARTRIALLSERDCVGKPDAYKGVGDEFFKIANIDNKDCTTESLEKFKRRMLKTREPLLAAFSAAYAKSA